MSSEETKALVKARETGIDAVINYYFRTKTPKEFIKTRPGAGGQSFKYVPIGYVLSQLNIAFGLAWEWKVIDKQIGKDQIWVQGELTIKDFKSGQTITRSGMGGAVIKKSKATGEVISIANDLKAADSDALKVAASKFGIGSDVKFQEMQILEDMPDVVDVSEGEAKSIKKITMDKYFAIAAERGFSGEMAKEKVKTAFNVDHMENLTKEQLERAIKAMEVRYQVVLPGEEPLAIGEYRKKPEEVSSENGEIKEGEILEENVNIGNLPEELCLYDGCTKGENGGKGKRLPDRLFCSVEGPGNCLDAYSNNPPAGARPRSE